VTTPDETPQPDHAAEAAEPADETTAADAAPAAAETELAASEPAASEPAASEPASESASASASASAAETTLKAPRLRPAVAAARAGSAARAGGRMVATGSRATVRAARRPPGRLVMGGLLIALLVAATIALGASLVPTSGNPLADQASSSPSTTTQPSAMDTAVPSPSFSPFPTVAASSVAPNQGLTTWADRLAPKVEIPPVALRAYGYAEYVLNARKPGCTLRWTTIAAIGKLESNHGRIGASTLSTDGRALPPIVGPALDGKSGRARVPDTDAGALDNDRAWDHAVGPMQFLPATWRAYAIDADGDGIVDPNDVDDAALAVATKLCESGKDLSQAVNWTAAIKTFPDLATKVQDVFTAANTYGQESRS
jgi:hypothetical protein